MVTSIITPAPPNGNNSDPQGHCSRCGKIWTLNEWQGICRWCGKPATCQTATTKPRHVKSKRKRKQTQDNANGNGYDQLPEPEHTYYIVALPFANGVPEREDLLHTIIANLIDAGRSNGHKPDNLSWMRRIASFSKAQYWRDHFKRTNGLDCGHCSTKQRRKCKEEWLYGDCPKLVKIESLHKPVIDSEGNLTEFGDLIADPDSLDPDIWDRDSLWQIGYKPRLVAIALKLDRGEALTATDSQYLWRYRKQAQNKLEGM